MPPNLIFGPKILQDEDEAKARDGLADRKADVKQMWLKPFPDNESLGKQIISRCCNIAKLDNVKGRHALLL